MGLPVVVAMLLAVSPDGVSAAKRTHLKVHPVGARFSVDSAVKFRLTARIRTGAHATRYVLDFGDGSKLRQRRRPPGRVAHRYERPGRYTVRFSVVDSKGARRTARHKLTVAAREPAPAFLPGPGAAGPPVYPPPPQQPPPPDPPRPVFAGFIELQPGSVATAELGEEVRVTELVPGAAMPQGIAVTLEGERIVVSASLDAPQSSPSLALDAIGCVETECGQKLLVWIPLTVGALEAPETWLYRFSSPSAERIAAGSTSPTGVTTLSDELLITIGSGIAPGSREEADAAAAAVGAVVSAGLEAIGVYELRWPGPQDIEGRRAELLALPGIADVSTSTIGLMGTTSVEPPGDWSDDGRQATWPFEQVRVGEAWDVTQGSDVTVGIVDGGLVYKKHEDLNVVTSLHGEAGDHATHVAGLACAKANGTGLVGMAWGCPIVSSGVRSGADKHVLEAATAVAQQPDVKVVNISMGYAYEGPEDDRCATAQQQQDLLDASQNYKRNFRNLFTGWSGREIVWTISAGNNCAQGAPGPMGANADLDNVITVAATNSDRSLASFSDFGAGVEVAAPGGVSTPPDDGDGTVGVWSTWYRSHCLPLGFGCGGYAPASGTSMAAPVVAGIAALVRSAHPGYDATAAAECITETAGHSTGLVTEESQYPTKGRIRHVTYSPKTLPIVDAEAAVRCDTFGPVEDSDYLGKWGSSFDVFEEAGSIYGVINEGETGYGNGCVDPPGQKIFSGMTRQPNGQWSGDSIAVNSTCQNHSYHPIAAMRLVRGSNGNPTLVFAWNTVSAGEPPTIEPDGTIVTLSDFHEMRLQRGAGGVTASTGVASAKRSQRPGAATLALPGAVLEAAAE